MDNPFFTIITVSFNSEDTIEETIISVLGQTYNNYEYIIKDGESNDGTVNIINKYERDISKIIIDEDSGIFDAMNQSIKISDGEWLIFLNADDVFLDNRVLEQLATHLNEDSGCKVYYTDYIRTFHGSKRKERVKESVDLSDFYFNQPINHQASVISNKAFAKVGLYNDNIIGAGDYEWYVRALSKGILFCYLPITTVVFDDAGITDKILFTNYEDRRKISKKYFPQYIYLVYLILTPYYFLKFKLLNLVRETQAYKTYRQNKYQ